MNMQLLTEADLADIVTSTDYAIKDRAAAQREYVHRVVENLSQPLSDLLQRCARQDHLQDDERPLLDALQNYELPLVRSCGTYAETTTTGSLVAAALP